MKKCTLTILAEHLNLNHLFGEQSNNIVEKNFNVHIL